MSKRVWFTALSSIALVCLIGSARTQSNMPVAGIVITPDGSTVPNASVEAVRLPRENENGNVGQLRWTQADNEGRFRITLSPGRYEIRAKDESEGYPDPNFLLSKDPHSDFPIITVDDRELSDVRVKLGAKGGILEGTLVDRMTGSHIEKGKVIIADARNPAVFMEVFANKEGRFQFVVPNKAIRISASAPGYPVVVAGDWITLAGGEHRNITIELSASAEPGRPR